MAVLVTDNRIIIVADGVLTNVLNGVGKPDPIPFCKIRREGDVFYGAVGDYGAPNTKTDVWRMAKRAAQSKVMLSVYDIIEPAMFKQLPLIVERNKSGDPQTYGRWLAGDAVTSIIFAAFEGGEPIVITRSFYIDAKGGVVREGGRRTLYAINGSLNTGRFGHSNEMTNAIASPSWIRGFIVDPIGAGRDLIQREIDASTRENRRDVGPPISIVTISREAGSWAKSYEGACSKEDQRPPAKKQGRR
jgi:hypothetical protein